MPWFGTYVVTPRTSVPTGFVPEQCLLQRETFNGQGVNEEESFFIGPNCLNLSTSMQISGGFHKLVPVL